MEPIPARIKTALLAGGTNMSFFFYNYNAAAIEAAKLELPKIYAAGARHIRLLLSMNTIEDGTTGNLRADRYQEVRNFALLAKAAGLVTIVDVHNTGMIKLRKNDGTVISPVPTDWETSDYMWGIRHADIAARHLKLLTQLAAALYTEDNLREWYVLTPANEPVYTGGSTVNAPSIWYNYQKQLLPAMRTACPDGVFTVVANDWNGIEATIYTLTKNMPFWDERMIVDCHFYEPLEGFTHTYKGDPTKMYPGFIKTWRTDQENWTASGRVWNYAELDRLVAMLTDWRDKDPRHPFCLISEWGGSKYCDAGSRLRYAIDLEDIFRKRELGYTVYTWSDNDWSIQTDPNLIESLWLSDDVPEPPPVDPPPVDPPPTDPPPDSGELEILRQEILRHGAEINALIERVSGIESQTADQNLPNRIAAIENWRTELAAFIKNLDIPI